MGPVYEQEIEANGWSDVTGDFVLSGMTENPVGGELLPSYRRLV